MTDPVTGHDERRHIDDQAAAWAAKRLSGLFTKKAETELNAWLDADPRHSIAYTDYMVIAETSAMAGAVGGMQSHANDAAPPETQTRRQKRRPGRGWLYFGAAAAASLFAAFFFTATQAPPGHVDRYAAELGETREISLPDGSTVTLNTDTVLAYSMDKNERRAVIERGEVFFDVARDESRPFTVIAGDTRATVLGTSFTIQKKAEASVVCVLSGTVSVSPLTKKSDKKDVLLTAGDQVVVASDGAVSPVNRFNTSNAATWRHGYLYFDETPLERVIADLNRYYAPQIEIGDAELGDAPVSGRIELGDQDVAIRALSVALSLEAERPNSAKIVLWPDD